MAKRPVYYSINKFPFYKEFDIDFKFHSGFSVSQKQKSIISLHKEYNSIYPNRSILEISSKSSEKIGISLSAFNLNIITSKRTFSVECAFQSSKVFENGGPYTDLLNKTSREAKKDFRLHESGKLISFKYFDTEFPLEPKNFFYNWIYINALYLNQDLANAILPYDSFTDIEFNPHKSINCQAKAAAIFVGLSHSNLLDQSLLSPKNFAKIIYNIDLNPPNKVYEEIAFNFDSHK